MKVLRVKPGQAPEVIDIENSVEALQKEVEGYFELYYPFDDCVIMVLNEEGQLRGLEKNRPFRKDLGNRFVLGTFLLVGDNGEDVCDLTEEQIYKYSQFYAD